MAENSPQIPVLRSIRYALETVAAYAVYGCFRLLPPETASNAGGFLLRHIGPKMGVSERARHNIRRAFPEKSAAEIEKIVRGMWDNLGRTIAEYPHLHDLWSRVELVGGGYLEEARTSGKPSIFFAGHLANWEVQPLAHKRAGLELHLVYRKPNNPWVDSLLRHARDSGAVGHIEKGSEGAREILSVLRKNGVIGMLVDQKLNEGISVPFFGRPAMTVTAIAVFALKFGCPLYPSRVERLGGAKFRLTFYPPLQIRETGNKGEDVRRIMTDINAMMEGWIRERPEQWLWLHNRWPKESP